MSERAHYCRACEVTITPAPDDEDAAHIAEHGSEDMEGEHIVHHVRDPEGDEAAHD